MLKNFLAPIAFVVIGALVIAGSTFGAISYWTKETKACVARWEGEIEGSFARQVREDLERARANKCDVLSVALMSPGGSVIQTFESVRAILAAREKGLVVEIHGQTLVASGATFVLAAGSPSYRFLDKNAVYLIHGARRQSSPFDEPRCLTILPDPQNENDRLTNEVLSLMAKWYSQLSGKSYKETLTWIQCNNYVVGPEFAVKRNLADHLE